MNVLLITPPMTQVNTPYPATAYLTAFLRSKGYHVSQADLGLELVLNLFSKVGLQKVKESITNDESDSVQFFFEAFGNYQQTIEPVIRFLQGKDPSLALRLANRKFVPEGPRFLHLEKYSKNILSQFGEMGIQDKAKYIASLYLDDLADVLKLGLDSTFEFSRYGESLASSQISFTPLYSKLHSPPSLIDTVMWELLENHVEKSQPALVGFTIPFPGNLLAGLRMAQYLKKNHPQIKIVMGGGFINTELRDLNDKRFFEFVDYLTYDDGEKPLEQLISFLEKPSAKASASEDLLRTKTLEQDAVVEYSNQKHLDISFKNISGPTYEGLPLGEYISMLELPNPMHRMWSDFRWNKMILAHGCYWKKCTFCDVNLDYIGRFEPARVAEIINHIQKIVLETGSTGFHFVDEAAPPALLKAMSKEIIKRKLQISWWGNLRFDVQFDLELCQLMADAGCVAVTGGLEVASPRVLKLINKGISVEQVVQVTKNFQQAGIYVHAYLMYGFPTQTVQETIDSLEVVRQLFQNDCLQSAHWHRFLVTAHSPVGRNPQKFGIELKSLSVDTNGLFARYEIPFIDSTKVDHEMLGRGLRKALYNYMHGVGLREDVQTWFDKKVPRANLKSDFVKRALKT